MTFLQPRKMKAALLLLLFCTFLFVFLSIKERDKKTIFVGKAGEKAEWTSPETEQTVIERSTKKKSQKMKEEKRAEKPGGRKAKPGKTNRTEYNGARCDGRKGKCAFGRRNGGGGCFEGKEKRRKNQY